MTSFEAKPDAVKTSETSVADATGTEAKKPEIQPIVVPQSRIQRGTKLWEEAIDLCNMLTYCRPDGSKTEKKFIARYLVPLDVTFDKYGNAYKKIGDNPTVLWSAHTDTVHRAHGFQQIEYIYKEKTGDFYLQVAAKCKSSCLGADDTAGIWLMLEMIKANIPGLYIFHRAEEVGGKGSKWIAENNKDVFNGIRYAIAFDRTAEKSIITYQRSKRCCSDEFAKSLAAELGMGHECDTGGSFTDTASYVDLIPECTNVSAGYYDAHCWDESLNVDYLFDLRDALLKLDVTKLVEKRKPGENTPLYSSYSYSGGNYYRDAEFNDYWGGAYGDPPVKRNKADGGKYIDLTAKFGGTEWMNKYEFDHNYGLWFPKDKKPEPKTDAGVTKLFNGKKTKPKYHRGPLKETVEKHWPQGTAPNHRDLVRMIRLNPEAIADLLEMDGYGPIQILDHLCIAADNGSIIII